MHKITILNTTIITDIGLYEVQEVTTEDVIQFIGSEKVESAVGHKVTAAIITELLGVKVSLNRVDYKQGRGDMAIAFQLKKRIPEGTVLSRKQIEEIGYRWRLIYRHTGESLQGVIDTCGISVTV